MKKNLRFIFHLDNEEEMLLRFAMRVTGLDKTTTIRLMMRRGIIEELVRYKNTGVPKLPPELEEFVKNY